MSDANDLKSIFGRAMEMESPDDRQDYLDHACANQPELRAEVEKLLSSLDDASEFMKGPALEPGATVDMPPELEKPGTRIGPYKLLQQIGEGGMGVVYMAEQVEPVTRRVALKVIKPGMDSQQVIARFEAEEQALAMMDHQNIARVLDAGLTDSGRPYFVMELVRGMPITEFCNSNKLNPQERLELFIPVCHAIQHAHQKGIIHRDIKPSNVLITHYDGKPVPKVIDFGVAKATQQRLTEKTVFTQFGQVVGTLEYMSPEQAELSHLDVDTRSDVYSLGIMLYELLTGSTPLDKARLKEVGFEEMLRLVREHEPQKPSTKLSTTIEALPAISAQRSTEPRKLGAMLKGELDWIVMKTLEKDRTRRYESASGLAADIERFLQHEPVEACPPSATYRFRKFARKHRAVMATATAIAASLVLGVVIATWQAVRATRAENVATAEKNRAVKAEVDANKVRDRAVKAEHLAEQRLTEVEQQRDEANKARQQAETVSEYLTEAFRSPNPELDGREIKVVDVLDRAVEQLDDSFTDDPNTKARLLHALGGTFDGLGLPREAVRLLEEAQQLLETERGPNHREVLRLRNDLSTSLIAAGQIRRALALQEETHTLCTEQLGPDDPDTLTAMSGLGEALSSSGRYLDAVTMHEDAFGRRQQVLGEVHKQTLESMSQLASAYSSVGGNSEARKLSERVLTLRREVLGADHPATLESESVLASYESSDGKFDEAISRVNSVLSRRRSKLGETHPSTINSLSQLAGIYDSKGREAEALRIHQEVLALRQKHLGPDHPSTLSSLRSIASLYSEQGRLDEAIELKQDAIEATRQKLGEKHPATLSAMASLAETYGDSTRYDDAIALYKSVLTLREQSLGHHHPGTLGMMWKIAWWQKNARQFDEAVQFCEQALERANQLDKADREETIVSINNVLAATYSLVGRLDEALQLSRDNLRITRACYGNDHPDSLVMLNNLAVQHDRSEHNEKAGSLYEELVELATGSYGRKHPTTLFFMHNLAWHYARVRRYDDAVNLGEELVESRKATLGLIHPHTIQSVDALVWWYRNAEAKDKALSLLNATLDELRSDHGSEHRATLEMEQTLATVLKVEHKYDEAIQVCTHILDVQKRKFGDEHRNTLTAMSHLASAFSAARDYDKAIRLREQIIVAREKSLGSDHRDTQTARSTLAAVFRSAKRYDEAIAIHEELLATRRERLGNNHFDTLSAIATLSTTYWETGRRDDSIKLAEERIELLTAKFSADHRITLDAKAAIVAKYRGMNQKDKERTVSDELIDQYTATLGPTHPTTMQTIRQAAWGSGVERKLELFELLYERHLQKHGEKHEATLRTANALGVSYLQRGRVEEAILLLERTNKLALELLGPDHLETALSFRHLADAYLKLGRTDEAITTSRKAVAGLVRILGPDDIWNTLHAKRLLALALQQNDKHEEAETIFLDLTEQWKGQPPSRMWRLGQARDDLTLNYLLQGKFAAAEDFWKTLVAEAAADAAEPIDPLAEMTDAVAHFKSNGDAERAADLNEQFLEFVKDRADDDDLSLSTRVSLARSYGGIDRLDDAVAMAKTVAAELKQSSKAVDDELLKGLHQLANALQIAEQYDLAETLYLKTVELWSQQSDVDWPELRNVRNHLARNHLLQGRFPEAETLLQETIETQNEVPTALFLAAAVVSQKRFDDAEPLLASVKESEQSLPASALQHLVNAYIRVGQPDEATTLLTELIECQEQRVGRGAAEILELLTTAALNAVRDGHREREIALLEAILARRTQQDGPEHVDTLSIAGWLCVAYRHAGQLQRSLKETERIYELCLEHHGSDHEQAIRLKRSLAGAYFLAGRAEESMTMNRECIAAFRDVKGQDQNHVAWARAVLAAALTDKGEYDEAEELCRAACQHWAGLRPATWFSRRHHAGAQRGLARSLILQQRYADAENICRQLSESDEQNRDNLVNRLLLATCLIHEDKLAEVHALFANESQPFAPGRPVNWFAGYQTEKALGLLASAWTDAGQPEAAATWNRRREELRSRMEELDVCDTESALRGGIDSSDRPTSSD